MSGFINKINNIFYKLTFIFKINKSNNTKKRRRMGLRENFISDTPDEEAGGKVNAISQNKTLYIGQFTNSVSDPELFQDAKTINDVFEHFKPSVDVEFQDEEGSSVDETLSFKEMKDFEVNNGSGQLVTNNSFLMDIKSNIDANAKMKKQIEQNKKLRDILVNKESKEELKKTLQHLLNELESVK